MLLWGFTSFERKHANILDKPDTATLLMNIQRKKNELGYTSVPLASECYQF